MKKQNSKKQSHYGFRLSLQDLCFVVVVCGMSALASFKIGPVVPMIFVHLCMVFFLFCNVFRVRTRHELAWIASYLAAVLVVIEYELPFWPVVLSVTTVSLIVVTLWAIMTGGYRGVCHPKAR